ncbi:MAG: penicillin acylase family protein [Rhodospirillales bacterium]|nr:penicillin acylase family protein [Rhodospirillales bacterium]
MRVLFSVALSWLLAGCSLLKPLPKEMSLDQRLSVFPTTGLPLAGPVTVWWDEHQIPFIEADRDDDAAFTLGMVHAHLRLGQMAIYRRIAAGRIAEMGGPLAADIDHGLRIIDFGKAAAETEASLSPEARRWIERFVAGINLYQERLEVLPYEYAALGLDREPWTVRDVLTFGRLSGTDVTWLVWFRLLPLRHRADWPTLWRRLVEAGSRSVPSFEASGGSEVLGGLLESVSRSGSNSIAIAPKHTTTGGALIASDPHLGLNLPNTWILAGLKSPSYHVVGMMVPGLPLFAIGRNPDIAWGGTNMRAAASDLVDLSAVPERLISERRETIRVRGWRDREITVRQTPWGPIISDAPQLADLGLPPLALRWTGHLPSDEISAMLAASRARSFAQFREAFATFSLPGQNMIYADAHGNIGEIMAVRLPARERATPEDITTSPETSDTDWSRILASTELPYSYNPEKGFLASANNRPTTAGDVRIGYFFSPGYRAQRMAEIVGQRDRLGAEDARDLQRDVKLGASLALRDAFLRHLSRAGLGPDNPDLPADQRAAVELMASWDGRYEQTSRGAVAFEVFRAEFTEAFYRQRLGDDDWQAFTGAGEVKMLLIEDLDAADAATVARLLRESLATAATRIDDFPTWGDMHRLKLRHPLAFLPLIGQRFEFADDPAGGSSETLMKTAHPMTSERHRVTYGSNARHISDMTDIDKNDFVLLGGQDGWLNSTTFLDQVPLWREGRYVTLPLRPETVRQRSVRRMDLSR